MFRTARRVAKPGVLTESSNGAGLFFVPYGTQNCNRQRAGRAKTSFQTWAWTVSRNGVTRWYLAHVPHGTSRGKTGKCCLNHPTAWAISLFRTEQRIGTTNGPCDPKRISKTCSQGGL